MNLDDMDHLLEVLHQRCFCRTGDVLQLTWASGSADRRAEMISGPGADWASMTDQTIWGAPQSYAWFAGQFVVPEALSGQRLYLWINAQFGRVMGRSDPQCLVRINGQIVQGADFNHREVLLTEAAVPGAQFDVMIEAGTIEDRRQIGFGCEVLCHDPLAEDVYFDLKTPLDVARHLPETDHRRDLILTVVQRALNIIDLRPGDTSRFHLSLAQAQDVANDIYGAQEGHAPHITVTGHTHIDVAWLWREQETRQKMARSMATALALMEAYPETLFMYNQGYLLAALAEDYPELFARLKQQHSAGRFEIEGALWLEPDANMTSGESLVRHLLRGIRFHQETFGIRPRVCWLPDTFGYSAAFPQILRQSGVEVFVTHKMSWNDTNRMPAETFFWQGLDGTKIPTYFLTTQPADSRSFGTTYCPDLTASHVMGAWRRYSQKGAQDQLWLVYGHGDGGGGPTRAMHEHLRRMARGIPGCPRVSQGFMGDYFKGLVARMQADPQGYPTWAGELYAEFHRGTYTSVAEVKRNNRKGEAALRELEALACLAMVRAGVTYPAEELAALWGTLLLNQFHDILPGSSIKEVYEDSRAQFAEFFEKVGALRERLSTALGGVVMNPLSDAWSGLVPVTNGAIQRCVYADGSSAGVIGVRDIPALGAVALDALGAEAAPGPLAFTTCSLENDHLVLFLDGQGRIASLTCKATGREMLTGPGNRLQAFRDLPRAFDAWDIDASYTEQMWEVDDLVHADLVETGPLRAAIRLEWRYEASRIVQILSLEADARQIEIETWADWQDPHTLLKAAFPLNIRTDHTVAEMQFGHVVRPTHANTSWDQARFEVPHHRWVALEEHGLGAALLNDCKYGYDAQGQTLRLTVLRAPTWPWDGADIGEHRFRYALALYTDRAEIHARAEAFNHPLRPNGQAGARSDLSPLLSVLRGSIAIEACKKAENNADLIVRMWEREGRSSDVQLVLAPEVTRAALCDLLEEAGEVLTLSERILDLRFAAFEIKTLRLGWEPLS
jgi:alpha-mannosidase